VGVVVDISAPTLRRLSMTMVYRNILICTAEIVQKNYKKKADLN
jgi:hypothetical protein